MKYFSKKSFIPLINRRRIRLLVLLPGMLMTFMDNVYSVELDVAYVETPEEIIDLMLDMSSVGRGDYVVDLGTGDGRIAIAAAKRGAVSLGVDLDPQRVQVAIENAATAGVSERVMFLEQDLFETDFSQASVVTMFLNESVNLKLRAALLDKLRPGARVVSHNFDMGDWQPDKHQQFLRNANNNFYIHDVYYWEIPAEVQGQWQGEAGDSTFRMTTVQEFQKIQVELMVNNQSLMIEDAYLHGNRINIVGLDQVNKSHYIFNGSIENSGISGIVQTRTANFETVKSWQAKRSEQ